MTAIPDYALGTCPKQRSFDSVQSAAGETGDTLKHRVPQLVEIAYVVEKSFTCQPLFDYALCFVAFVQVTKPATERLQ